MQTPSIDFDARVNYLKHDSGLRYTNAFFEIIADGIVKKYLPEMDAQLGKKHSFGFYRGDRGFEAIHITIPKDQPAKGFWKKLWWNLNKEERVIYISVCWGWSCEAYRPEYKLFAERMTCDYHVHIASRL